MINALPTSNSQLANHCQDLNKYLSYIKKNPVCNLLLYSEDEALHDM